MTNNQKYDFYTTVPNIEMAIGISWDKYFCCRRYLLTVVLGYEFHQFWNINQARRWYDGFIAAYNDQVRKKDLSLNGLSFKIGLSF